MYRAAVAVVPLLLLAACAPDAGEASDLPPEPALATTGATAPATTAVASEETAEILAPMPAERTGGVSARFEFDRTEVVAGGELHGTLVVTNDTGERVERRHQGCQPKWHAMIDSQRSASFTAFTLDCILEPLVFEVGETRHDVTVSARASWCSQDDDAPVAHRCTEGLPPPLSPGDYFVVVASNGGMVKPPALPITVVAADV